MYVLHQKMPVFTMGNLPRISIYCMAVKCNIDIEEMI